MQETQDKTIVGIIIAGEAICYQKDGISKVIFPFDKDHDIKLFANELTLGSILQDLGAQAKPKRTIKIITDNPVSRAETDNSFSSFFDLKTAHEDGIALKENWDEKAILMEIPNSKMASYRDTEVDYYLYPHVSGNTDRPTFDRKVGRVGFATLITIELSAGKTLKIITNDDGGDGTTIKDTVFETEPDASYILVFNNICQKRKEPDSNENDFDMFYQVIKDKKDEARQFRLRAKPRKDKQKLDQISPGSINLKDFNVDILTGILNNLWGQKPCFNVTSSEIADLP